ncbi:TetR/AcrR family transcriptional regulator [Brachybacterium sp. NBEC-018]|uniref:TetR/AcrR family transcriptional regulator n=1 Tax=Brachybacterium sp. NBEC-018 TaxID=2996004 RepID=UPI002174ECC4|nr:TetR/AcrR family transcriptional regulator [Brachybacterium sp. NBEC-018]UVY84473.1 TetR/AcrR family transcriptional regulator [Brachybacterium sp. NBEC-018]
MDTDPAPRRRSATATREQILTAANALFYTHGIRATSADRVIAEAGITKVTFYRHFPTKSQLVVAYLERQAEAERAWLTGLHRGDDPHGTLQALAAGIGEASCSPGFRGCAFINAAAEFADPGDPVRLAVDTHRGWTLALLTEIAAEAGAPDPAKQGRELQLLRDGAMVGGYLGTPDDVASVLASAFSAVISPRP